MGNMDQIIPYDMKRFKADKDDIEMKDLSCRGGNGKI